MPLPIEDYAVIGDCHTAALVGRDGSIDWLCLPRFDSGACFAALLGGPGHGRWLLAPAAEVHGVRRKYREGTLILETEFDTNEGAVRIIDCMPLSNERWDVLRIVEGLSGRVAMRMELIIRFDYGSIVPWVRRSGDTLLATAGPDTLELHTQVAVHGESMKTVAEFHVSKGERAHFSLNYRPSHEATQRAIDPEQTLTATENHWRKWSERCNFQGRWRDAVMRSLITLKALTYAPTGGIVAAPTTSLPEQQGGVRNWDYRYCWLRDATFTLNALLLAGYQDEAVAWREWLLRAAAGAPKICRYCTASPASGVSMKSNRLAARLSGRGPGAHGQRGIAAVPARRLRRSHGHAASGASRRPGTGAGSLADTSRFARISGIELAAAG